MPAHLRCLVLGLLVALASAWALPSIAAPLRPEMTPEEVNDEAFARLIAKDWAGYVDTFDPVALREFRQTIGPVFEMEQATVVAFRLFARPPAELKRMSDREFFIAFLGTTLGGALGEAKFDLEMPRVLGSVSEGPDTVHLVVRTSGRGLGMQMTQMEVITLQRTAQGWRMRLNGELEGLGRTLQALASRWESDEDTPATLPPLPDPIPPPPQEPEAFSP